MKANKIKATLLIGAMLYAGVFGVYVLLAAWVTQGDWGSVDSRFLTAIIGLLWFLVQTLLLEASEVRAVITKMIFDAAVSDE